MWWLPKRLRPSYWQQRWAAFTRAEIPRPAAVITHPDVADHHLAEVTGSVRAPAAAIAAWWATWLAQVVCLALLSVQIMSLVRTIQTDLDQCGTGRCGDGQIAAPGLWAIVWLVAFLALIPARTRIERICAQLAVVIAQAQRRHASHAIVVDDLTPMRRWALTRAAGLLDTYRTIRDDTLWYLALLADLAERLPREDADLRDRLDAQLDDVIEHLRAARDARAPARITIPTAGRRPRPRVPTTKTATGLLPTHLMETR